MKYILPTSFYHFVTELVKIRKGIHPDFRGDKIYNSEAVCFDFGRHYPEDAEIIVNSLLANAEYIDLTKTTINILVKKIREGIEYS